MKSYPIVNNVTLSLENISNEIFEVISSIRPDWTSSNTRLITFTEGITNSIFGLFDKRTPDDESQALVIKLFGKHTELFIDRHAEIDAMIKLSQNNVLSQKILIQFNNGLIYEYASGKPCSREDVRKENISKLIAIKLAQFHNVPIDKYEKPSIILLLRKFAQLINENKQQDISKIVSDIEIIETSILPNLLPNPVISKDLVLCHNDLLVKNIIFNEKSETISFIDFEYAHLNYALFDIANHFVEYAGVDDADFSLYPTRDEQKQWLKIYFQTRQMDEQIIDDDLCHLVDKFSALSHLMWGLWAVVQSRVSLLDFDYVNYSKLRLDCYQKLRTILFENLQK
jgi:ethanolamine kinase